MEHTHGPNCGCSQYMEAENANDLFGVIDIERVRCLNQEVQNSGREVFKDFDERFDKQKYVASDCDGELLLIIPFISQVKLRSICIIAKGLNKFPNKMKLYTNSQNVDFSLTEQTPVQEFIIPPNQDGSVSNALKITKFGNVHKLIIHLSHEGEEVIEVSYVQIKGENTNIKRQAVQAVYEVQPNAKKNEMKDLQKNPFQMG